METRERMDAKPKPPALRLNAVVQDIPAKGDTHLTGFPEPLSPHRNTTLRHPSADTSPNACIESSDVPLSRTHSRVSSRHSFRFGHKHKGSRADGPIDMSAFPAPVVGRASGGSSIEEILDGSGSGSGESIGGVADADGKADASTVAANEEDISNGNANGNTNGNTNGNANGNTNGNANGNGVSKLVSNGTSKKEYADEEKEGVKKRRSVLRKLHLHH